MSELYTIEVRYYPKALSWQVKGCVPVAKPKDAMAVTWSTELQRVWLPSPKPLRAGCWVSPRKSLSGAWELFYDLKREAISQWEEFLVDYPEEATYFEGTGNEY